MTRRTYGALLAELEKQYIEHTVNMYFWDTRCNAHPDNLVYCEIRNREALASSTLLEVLRQFEDSAELMALKNVAAEEADNL